jgi:DNA polymerase I
MPAAFCILACVKKFVIIDGNAIVHRSYHAVPKTLHGPDGRLTNAVHGFTSILLGILERERPDYLAVAFDMKGPTFRHETFSEYKGTRKKTDDELIAQFPMVREVLEAMNVPIFEKPGLEADDYLGIVAKEVEEGNLNGEAAGPDSAPIQTVIVTGDQDALQLVRDGVTVVTPLKGYTEVKVYDREAVKGKLGVWPEQVTDYKGLRGDSSDNIPGVPGVGEKTAVRLIEQFGSLEAIYERLKEVEPERIRGLLRDHEEDARMSKEVATILTEDGDLDFDLARCEMHDLEMDCVRDVFEKFAFRTLTGRVERLNRGWEKRRVEEQQVSLF